MNGHEIFDTFFCTLFCLYRLLYSELLCNFCQNSVLIKCLSFIKIKVHCKMSSKQTEQFDRTAWSFCILIVHFFYTLHINNYNLLPLQLHPIRHPFSANKYNNNVIVVNTHSHKIKKINSRALARTPSRFYKINSFIYSLPKLSLLGLQPWTSKSSNRGANPLGYQGRSHKCSLQDLHFKKNIFLICYK